MGNTERSELEPAFFKNNRKQFYEDEAVVYSDYASSVFNKPYFETDHIYILQNRYTASAAEDFVVAMGYNTNAIVLGENSFGSSGQTFSVLLPDGGTCMINNRHCYSPDGKDFNNSGIMPDISLPIDNSLLFTGRDSWLDTVLGIARNA